MMGMRVNHEKKSDGVRVHQEKKSDGVRVYHEKEGLGESSPLEREVGEWFTMRKRAMG